ncbi:MAG: cysteine synthase A [Methanobacteriota archaeon]|nr:MAG: cysteine synthase A [Euryarchaeota archaeon]
MSAIENTACILEAIGNTPVVRLKSIVPADSADIYAKIESLNPMGSIKDRIAKGMVDDGERRGIIKKGTVLVEPTSGNTGVGLAMVCAVKGYRLILTMPDTMSIERRRLLSALGAEIVLTPGALGMKGAVEKAEELVRSKDNAFMPQQFKNPANPETHERTTAKEIVEEFDSLDAFVAGVGTGGTITGVGRVLRQKFPGIRIVAVEPDESAVLSGDKPGSHGIQGIGAGFVPETLDTTIYDEVIRVSTNDAVKTSRQLALREGLLLGISSGAAAHGALRVAANLGPGRSVLVIMPDTGERYLSTDLFEEKSHD